MLLTSQQAGKVEAEPLRAADSIETLQQIIAKQEQRKVDYDEAQEVASH